MNKENTLTKFNDSFERCINDPFFLDQFYEVFLSSSKEVSLMFKNTDMGTQTLKIRETEQSGVMIFSPQ